MSLGGPSGALAPVPQAQAESHYLITIVNDVPFCSTCASVMGRDRQSRSCVQNHQHHLVRLLVYCLQEQNMNLSSQRWCQWMSRRISDVHNLIWGTSQGHRSQPNGLWHHFGLFHTCSYGLVQTNVWFNPCFATKVSPMVLLSLNQLGSVDPQRML